MRNFFFIKVHERKFLGAVLKIKATLQNTSVNKYPHSLGNPNRKHSHTQATNTQQKPGLVVTSPLRFLVICQQEFCKHETFINYYFKGFFPSLPSLLLSHTN